MMIQIKNLTKVYKDKLVVDINKYEFKKGKIHAILGANGAGKTTLLRIIAGVEKATDGTVFYDESPTIDYSKVYYMPQQSYLFDMTVLKNVTLGLDKSKETQDKVLEALKYVDMENFAEKNATKLSGGESQRVAIARLFVRKRELVLMDEPSSSTDIIGNKLLVDYIKKVNDNGKTTIIIVTHSPSLACKIADESIFMMNGRIIESGSTEEIIDSPKTSELKAFLENWRI